MYHLYNVHNKPQLTAIRGRQPLKKLKGYGLLKQLELEQLEQLELKQLELTSK